MAPERKDFFWPLVAALIWAVVIFLLCNLDLGEQGTRAWYYFEGIDKVVHMLLFFGLGFLSCWAFSRKEPSSRLWGKASRNALLICALYGGLIEILQGTLFTYRSADWLDWLFDLAGALAGISIFHYAKKLLGKRKLV